MSPLDRANVTVASRIMLPVYVALTAAYGLTYAFDPLHRLRYSHSLDFAVALMGGSMRPWGLLFLAISLVLLGSLLRRSRAGYLLGLCISAAVWLGWAGIYAVAIWTDTRSSVLAPVAPLVFFAAAIASALSVMKRER